MLYVVKNLLAIIIVLVVNITFPVLLLMHFLEQLEIRHKLNGKICLYGV